MFEIDELTKVMTLTRGDTAEFTVPVVNKTNNNSEYVFRPGDKMTFSVKKKAKKEFQYLINKVFVGTNKIYLDPADTEDIAGGTYAYDVQLDTVEGKRYTVVGPYAFVIVEGVTD